MNRMYMNNHIEENDTLNIREEVEKYLIHWKWFVFGVIVAILGAYLHLKYTTPQYKATTTIIIKGNKKSGISAELETFKDLGIVGARSNNNLDNEIEIIKSRKIVSEVVKKLNLTDIYISEGRIKKNVLYKESPIKLNFLERDSTVTKSKDTVIIVKVDPSQFTLFNQEKQKIGSYAYDEVVTSNLGKFKIQKVNSNEKKYPEIKIVLTAVNRVASGLASRIKVAPINTNSSVLKISLNDPVIAKAKDILDELVNQYNKDAIQDKNQVSKKTRDFIKERLEEVGKELSIIDDNVKNFKLLKGFTGVPKETEMIFEALSKNNEKIIAAEAQLRIIKGVQKNLNTQTQKEDILPNNLGFNDVSIAQSINTYNELIFQRNKLRENAGRKNPQLIELNTKIVSLKNSIQLSLNNLETSTELQLNQLKRESVRANSRVSSIPDKERGFIDIARHQEIIAGLYSYLLKKREETGISLAVTVPNAKIIDKAYSFSSPVSPNKRTIYLIAIVIGLLGPFFVLYLRNLLDTKVYTKNDIEDAVTIPFLGDVPKSETKEKIVVGGDVRSSTAEAFRLLRTNLDFMLAGKRKESKSIFVTSTTSGEGKSFMSINLAATLALSGKKVLLVGMDLRAPKVTEYLGVPDRKGVTNYITNESITLDELKFQIPEVKNLDIIASGVIPPNPAELLMTKRVENMFTILKEEYDYVIVDTAPVNLVTDTLLIARHADMFIYVTRANYLDKRLLSVPQSLYTEKRLPNMAIVLNDTNPKRSYGYGYGGYGYGYVVVEKPWYKKIFDRS